MNKAYEKVEIISNEEISKDIFKMVVKGNFNTKVGQFYMIKCFEDGNMLPRPISICDATDSTLTFLYAVVGKGTLIMSQREKGKYIEILGPLGNGFPICDENERVAIVAGGIGIAPMLYLAKKLNKKVDLYAGFRDDVYFMEDFKDYVDNIFISTNDGSTGHKGFITEIIKDDYDAVYCCGPNPMMNSVKNLNLNCPVYVSLESRMACGIGACLACSCRTTNE